MIYQFTNPDGEIVERSYPIGTAPKIGERIVIDGVPCTRICSAIVADGQIAQLRAGFPRVSRSLPKWLPGCKHDKMGRPIIRSQAHEREIKSMTGFVKD